MYLKTSGKLVPFDNVALVVLAFRPSPLPLQQQTHVIAPPLFRRAEPSPHFLTVPIPFTTSPPPLC